MNQKIAQGNGSGQADVRDRSADERSESCDLADEQLWLADLKQAMTDTGWTIDALAAHYGIHRSYVERMLDGEKPFSVRRIVGLPNDLESKFEAIRAERLGNIVVQPLSGRDAQRAFVAGLVGLMSASSDLPMRASAMAKATAADRKKVGAA